MWDFSTRKPARTYVGPSRLPEENGLFAQDRIKAGEFLGIYSGIPKLHGEEVDDGKNIKLFQITHELSIHPEPENGLYFINHMEPETANAEFKHIESGHSRIVIAVATKDIKPHEEIFAPYQSGTPKGLCPNPPELCCKQYRRILGIDKQKKECEWIGQIVRIQKDVATVTLRWFYQAQDVPRQLSIRMGDNELLMAVGSDKEDDVAIASIGQLVSVTLQPGKSLRGGGDMRRNKYWCSRTFDIHKKRVGGLSQPGETTREPQYGGVSKPRRSSRLSRPRLVRMEG